MRDLILKALITYNLPLSTLQFSEVLYPDSDLIYPLILKRKKKAGSNNGIT